MPRAGRRVRRPPQADDAAATALAIASQLATSLAQLRALVVTAQAAADRSVAAAGFDPGTVYAKPQVDAFVLARPTVGELWFYGG